MDGKRNTSSFFQLLRPEYVVNPELFQIALVWEEMGEVNASDGKNKGDVYLRDLGDPQSVDIRRTAPLGNHVSQNKEQEFLDALKILTNKPERENRVIGEALVNSLAGIRSPRATAQCALPITLPSTLLQNMRGVTGKLNPSRLGKNINTLYSLGGRGKHPSASSAWWSLQSGYEEYEPIRWIQKAVEECILPQDVKNRLQDAIKNTSQGPTESESPPAWLVSEGIETPFSWFCNAWDFLCTKEWYAALPRRRWSDWASCVLRTVVGMGYLWEMHFYSRLLIGILDEDLDCVDVANGALSSSSGLFVWDNAASIPSRDVSTYMKRLVQRGSHSLDALASLIKDVDGLSPSEFHDDEDGLVKWVEATRRSISNKQRDALGAALGAGGSTGWKNTEEAIRYALLCRDPFGRNADYYGLLKKRGSRYTIVDPSSEWIVVVASLAAPRPDMSIRMEDVKNVVGALGLKPDYHTLISEIERAGLGRGSHDADEAVEVVTGF